MTTNSSFIVYFLLRGWESGLHVRTLQEGGPERPGPLQPAQVTSLGSAVLWSVLVPEECEAGSRDSSLLKVLCPVFARKQSVSREVDVIVVVPFWVKSQIIFKMLRWLKKTAKVFSWNVFLFGIKNQFETWELLQWPNTPRGSVWNNLPSQAFSHKKQETVGYQMSGLFLTSFCCRRGNSISLTRVFSSLWPLWHTFKVKTYQTLIPLFILGVNLLQTVAPCTTG